MTINHGGTPTIRLALLFCDSSPLQFVYKIFDTWLRKRSPVDHDFTFDA